MKRKSNVEIELRNKASLFRQQNGLSITEPVPLKSLLLKNNVLTVFKPLSGSFSGMAVKINEHRFILVNTNHNIGKQNFTIAHELYHLFIQENFNSQTCHTGTFNKKHPEEYKADVFAAYLLIPEEGISQMIPDGELQTGALTLPTILKIEQYYGVSRRALLYRLLNLGYIDQALHDSYKENVKLGASKNGYSTALYDAGNDNEIIGDYGALANLLLEKRKISESYYFELMTAIGFKLEDFKVD